MTENVEQTYLTTTIFSFSISVWANVDVNMEDRVEVFRGDTAQITCLFTSSDGVGGMIIQWFYVKPSGEKQKIYYQDTTMKFVDRGTQFTERMSVNGTGATGEIVLTISNVQPVDEVEFICLIKGLTDGTGEGRTKLKIGICEVKNGFPMPNITWYRNNTPLRADRDVVKVVPSITTESTKLVSVRSELSMKVTKEDKDNLFYCEITYFIPGGTKMTETNRINITVYYPSTAVSVWVESPKGKIKEGDSIEIHCQGNGNMPSSFFKISKKGSELAMGDGNVLVMDNVTRHQSGVYECTSTDTDTFDEISGNTTVFVNFLDPAVVMPEDTVVVAQGEDLMATCNALSSLSQTQTVWIKNGVEISVGHSLTLKNNTFETAGTYMCVVTVPEIEGMETNGTLTVYVQGKSDYRYCRLNKKLLSRGRGVIIAVIIICILLLAILGSVLYFLYKKGKICGRSGKQDLTKEKSSKDNIVVEMKSDNTEEAVLLGVNGEKQPPNDQSGEYLDVQK
uniref:Melanoma cell adhesion molecule b n=1 Tax=Sander lucioperca TaxID=283035 RepID=A0A8C9YPB6_SANLU